jgi:uncharacterized membrane protein
MESRIKLLGHPIHPMLIVLPLGLFSIGLLFDVVYLVTGTETFADVAFWDISVGIVGGLIAAPFGLVDWVSIPNGTRAKQVGLIHGAGNVLIVVLFIISWLLRLPDYSYAPNLWPFILALVGVGLALVTAWLGGELVYRLRVGVDDHASLDAPSSLGAEVGRGDRGGTAAAG